MKSLQLIAVYQNLLMVISIYFFMKTKNKKIEIGFGFGYVCTNFAD